MGGFWGNLIVAALRAIFKVQKLFGGITWSLKAARSASFSVFILSDLRLYQLLNERGRGWLIHREADGAFGCLEILEFFLKCLNYQGTHREQTAMVRKRREPQQCPVVLNVSLP
jgi:hypothetical protein